MTRDALSTVSPARLALVLLVGGCQAVMPLGIDGGTPDPDGGAPPDAQGAGECPQAMALLDVASGPGAGPGYAAAVAAEGAFHVRRYRWDG